MCEGDGEAEFCVTSEPFFTERPVFAYAEVIDVTATSE